MNTIPWFAGAGLMVRVTFSPVWIPMPSQLDEFFIVFCLIASLGNLLQQMRVDSVLSISQFHAKSSTNASDHHLNNT
jgi:hypothetical protein